MDLALVKNERFDTVGNGIKWVEDIEQFAWSQGIWIEMKVVIRPE